MKYSSRKWGATPFEDFEADGRILERAVFTKLGYDCRDGCTADCPHKDKRAAAHRSPYGQSGDDHIMVLRFEDGVAALQFFSSFREGRVVPYPKRSRWHLRPAYLQFCFTFPVDSDVVREGRDPYDCRYQRKGVCYPVVR